MVFATDCVPAKSASQPACLHVYTLIIKNIPALHYNPFFCIIFLQLNSTVFIQWFLVVGYLLNSQPSSSLSSSLSTARTNYIHNSINNNNSSNNISLNINNMKPFFLPPSLVAQNAVCCFSWSRRGGGLS